MIEACRAGGAARVQLERDHRRPSAAGQETGGAAEPSTDIEDATRGPDVSAPGQRVDGGHAAVVVLVEGEEIVGGYGAGKPAARGGREHAGLADRMIVVVLPHAPRGALKHDRGYGKSKPVSSHRSAREDQWVPAGAADSKTSSFRRRTSVSSTARKAVSSTGATTSTISSSTP